MSKRFFGRMASGVMALALGCASAVASADSARVYLISPADGESVRSPVIVRFGLSGMGVAPAGIEREGTGHHHLLIDVADLPELSRPLPNDQRHRHFGAGQTEAAIELPPGEHTLRLIFADHNHVPHDPPLISEDVTITVVP
ncbi:MAG: DUF4399 domain-containing protein [Gammaproteobacteria bacterium]|jgi:hypothetical protein|nr:DUF4399 domain-containing protein [Gammaproteobacteria bacterium]